MATTTTPTTARTPGPTRLTKVLFAAALLASAGLATKHFAPGLFGQRRTAAASSVPPKAELPTGEATASRCQADETRMLIWAWNAQQGLLYANGAGTATADGLMCKHGVNLVLARQDAADQMQAELVKCAHELGHGDADCKNGAHFVAIMGDGAAAFLAAVNPELAKQCPDCTAEIVGSAGYSRGEDKLMGPPAWKQSPTSAAGGLIAGYLRDGDWNIAMKWAGDNMICNNPDETTYDPSCLNWVAAADYLDAAQKYVTGYCEDRRVVSGPRQGQTAHVCVNGVVTWTPGDVNVAHGRGGLVSIASTREYAYQMPNVIIGLHHWNQAHKAQVTGMLRALTDGGQQVKTDPAARRRAAEISAAVYHEQDGAYWARYVDVVREADKQGQEVELGGSAVNNLADNLHLFGVAGGEGVRRSIFGATYNVFGNIVVHYYPRLVPSFPAVERVVDTSYLEAIAKEAPVVAAELPTYSADAQADASKPVIGHRDWKINFESGSDRFTRDAMLVLADLYDQTVVTQTTVEITGHTDADGDAEANRELSRRRALAVRDYMMNRSPVSFPASRFRVMGLGEDAPIADNATAASKAKNRRVEITMRTL